MEKREIKFMAWDGKRMHKNVGTHPHMIKSLVKNPKCENSDSDCEYEQGQEGSIIVCQKFASYKLMQYTGLKDRNGKEIYEGDLLNIGAKEFGFVTDHDNKLVKYEVALLGVDYVLYRTDLKLHWGRLSRIEEIMWQCEVCGNIYETPELLQTKNK